MENIKVIKRPSVAIKIARWSGLIIFVGLVAALIIAVGLGRAYIGVKDPGQKVQLTYTVCDDAQVKKYNDIATRSQSAQTDADTAGYKNEFEGLTKEVTAKANADKDPSCQYILFLSYQYQGDLANMRKAAGNLVSLSQDGKYINNKIGDQVYSTSELESFMSNKGLE